MQSPSSLSLRKQARDYFCCEKVGIWIYEHPTTVKVIQIALLIVALGTLVSLPFTAPLLPKGVVGLLATVGSLLTLATITTWCALDLLVPPHHNMRKHLFKPGSCEGGRLYYEGDVPILSLDADNPQLAGKAHGYLCGAAINRLVKRLAFVFMLGRMPKTKDLPKTAADIQKVIPDRYLEEMKGLVEGYTKWASEHWWLCPKKITLEDLVLLHLMPDSLHFDPTFYEREQNEKTNALPVACTTLIGREKGEIQMVRTMDWPSFGLTGSYTLCIHRHYSSQHRSTVEVGMPGFVGILTGMNDKGLAMAMNVCGGASKRSRKIEGAPAIFYNRQCLEACGSVDEVTQFISQGRPLAPYHLTFADPERAQSVHFFQGEGRKTVTRRWNEENQTYLSVLNCQYFPSEWVGMHYHCERKRGLEAFFAERESGSELPLEEATALPYVNNWITTHRVSMEPRTMTFKYAADNAFAGHRSLHTVPTTTLFGSVTPTQTTEETEITEKEERER